MKLLKFMTIVFFLFGIGFSTTLSEAAPKIVTTKITAKGGVYKLGEIVEVDWSIRNNTSKTIELGGDSKSWSYFQIASEMDKDYRLYSPGGGSAITLDGVNFGLMVGAKKTFVHTQEFLWNYRPQVSHLNVDAAARETKGRILTELAFPIAGSYFIRMFTHVNINGVISDYISEPAEIKITIPDNRDAFLWERMKENPDIAYFMQYSDLPRGKYFQNDQRDAFQQTIQNLVSNFPDSQYSMRLGRTLHNFRIAEKKRLDSINELLTRKRDIDRPK